MGIHGRRGSASGTFGCGLAHGQENEDGVFPNDQVASGPWQDATGRVVTIRSPRQLG